MHYQTTCISFLILVLTCFAHPAVAQHDLEQTIRDTELVRLRLDLTDEDLRNLEHVGRLQMRIPEYFKNRVAAIQLRYVDTYLEKKIRVDGEPTTNKDIVHLTVDDILLERIRFQPVEYRVFEKNFSRVQINHEESEDPVFVANANEGFTDQEFGIRIADRLRLTARISLESKLNFASDLGNIQIGWNDIDEMTFAADEALKATVNLKTGDILTGFIDLSELTIKTKWGHATIPVDDIRTILPNRQASLKDTGVSR